MFLTWLKVRVRGNLAPGKPSMQQQETPGVSTKLAAMWDQL